MDISSTITNWLWVGFFGMLAGTALIYIIGSNLKLSAKYHMYLAMVITSIAALAYYAMANSQGIFMINGKEIFVGRYIDWVITTPLLLLSLMLVALPAVKDISKIRERLGLMGTIIFADVVMIVTGLFANLSSGTDNKRFWFIISCLAFFAVLYYMFTTVKESAAASGPKVNKIYMRLLTYLTVLWFIYPIVWLLGTSGSGSIDLGAEVAIYAVLDLLAKAGFGVMLVMFLIDSKKTD